MNPVISPVPERVRGLKPKEKIEALSGFARKVVLRSLFLAGKNPIEFKKDDKGVPLPDRGIYWSLSHKPFYAAGVWGHQPLGIDIEQVQPVRQRLFDKIVSTTEARLFGFEPGRDDVAVVFFRAFTAKEAVLKKMRIGLKGLPKTKIVAVDGPNHLVIDFENKKNRIEHFYLDDHIVSVTKELSDVQWMIEGR